MPASNERSNLARAAALQRVGQVGGDAVSAPARRAFLQRFLDQTDSDLPMHERQRRAEALLRAHMTRLAGKSAAGRRIKHHAAELRAIAQDAAQLADEIESEPLPATGAGA